MLAIVASSTGILNGRGVVDLRFGFGGGGVELERVVGKKEQQHQHNNCNVDDPVQG